MIRKVTGAVHVHVFHHQLRDAKDNADCNGFNTSVQPYVVAVHSNSSRYAAEEVFLRFAGNTVDAKFCKGRFVYINAWRNITTDPIENNHLAVYDETYLVSLDDNLASDLFMPGARLTQYGLDDHNAAKHRGYYFPKMQMDEASKQFESDTALPGCTIFNIREEEFFIYANLHEHRGKTQVWTGRSLAPNEGKDFGRASLSAQQCARC